MNESKTYAEVIAVLDNLVDEDYEKIPKSYIEHFKNKSEKNVTFKYDMSKSFSEQGLSNEAQEILFGLFFEFVANERQKEKINAYIKNYNYKLESEKSEQKLFYKNTFKCEYKEDTKNNVNTVNNESLISYRENIFRKFITKLKNLFNKKNNIL